MKPETMPISDEDITRIWRLKESRDGVSFARAILRLAAERCEAAHMQPIPWSKEATEHEKALVIGNRNHLFAAIRRALTGGEKP